MLLTVLAKEVREAQEQSGAAEQNDGSLAFQVKYGCGSKIGTQKGTLVNGNKESNLSPGGFNFDPHPYGRFSTLQEAPWDSRWFPFRTHPRRGPLF